MKDFKLNIDLIPKGAWGNNLRTLLSEKDWELLREECYKKANHHCQICGVNTDDLDAHEVWKFNIKTKTQTLKDIIGICNKCHGVIHYRNSDRLGYGENAKQHFMQVNNATELEFATNLTKALITFENRNKVYRWKLKADLEKFGLTDAEIKQRNIPFIKNPYEDIDWNDYDFVKFNYNQLFFFDKKQVYYLNPRVLSINVDNYQGIIQLICNDANKLEWYLDNVKIKTKYNLVGKFITTLKVENLKGKYLKFKLIEGGGETISKPFELLSQEVL